MSAHRDRRRCPGEWLAQSGSRPHREPASQTPLAALDPFPAMNEIKEPVMNISETVPMERRRAIVVGAAGGIGSDICRRMALEGYRVVVADYNEDRAREEIGRAHV